jgi:hypothetical protein
MEDTDWDRYGVGRNPRCDNCMAHCGFEGTAVNDALAHPLKALTVSMRGPRLSGPMAPDPPILYAEHERTGGVVIPLTAVKRARTDTARATELQ